MAETPTLYASNTQLAVVTTEHFLSSPNVAGVFQLVVDMVNMAAGDILEIRCYRIVLTGGTVRQAYYQRYEGAQTGMDIIAEGPLMGNDLTDTNSLRFSIQQNRISGGTGRNFPWKVLQY